MSRVGRIEGGGPGGEGKGVCERQADSGSATAQAGLWSGVEQSRVDR